MEAFAIAKQMDMAAQLAQSVAVATDGNAATSPVPPTVFARRVPPEQRCLSGRRSQPRGADRG